MRLGVGGREARPMTKREHAELRLTLELGTGTIRGSIADGHGAESAFVGWLGLANALERALAAAEARGGAAPLTPQESS
jgi:hypothetical protein